MIPLACESLGVILDTSVFVCWCDGEPSYGSLMDIIRQDGLFIVLCPTLRKEYESQLHRRFVGAGWQVLKSRVQKLESEGILRHENPLGQREIRIHRKDQHVIDCALNKENPVHIIVTDNVQHFVSEMRAFRLPLIVTHSDFLDDDHRHTDCSEAKRIHQRIQRTGEKERYQ